MIMTVAAFYDEGRYDQSYYDNQNPAELIEITEKVYSTIISEQAYTIALSEQVYVIVPSGSEYTINLSEQTYSITTSDSERVEET